MRLTLLWTWNRKSCMSFNLHIYIWPFITWRFLHAMWIKVVHISLLTNDWTYARNCGLCSLFTLEKVLLQQNSSQIINVLDVRFSGKICWIRFCCMQIGRWHGVSSTILTPLLHRSKWSRTGTVLSYKAVWIDICSSVTKCTWIKRIDLEAPISPNICTLTK